MSKLGDNPLASLPWYGDEGQYSVQRYFLDSLESSPRLGEVTTAYRLGLIPTPSGVERDMVSKRLLHLEESYALDDRQRSYLQGLVLGLLEPEQGKMQNMLKKFIKALDDVAERGEALSNFASYFSASASKTPPPKNLWDNDLIEWINSIGEQLGLGDEVSPYRGVLSDESYMLNPRSEQLVTPLALGKDVENVDRSLELLIQSNTSAPQHAANRALSRDQWRAVQGVAKTCYALNRQRPEWNPISVAVAENLSTITWDHLVKLNGLMEEYNLEWALAAMEWS